MLRTIPEVNVNINALKTCKLITTFTQEDVEVDTVDIKTVEATSTHEDVAAGAKAEADTENDSSRPSVTTADNDFGEGPENSADTNRNHIFNVNNIEPCGGCLVNI